MFFDSHMHTKFSSDSSMIIDDAITIAKKNNIGIILTEHLDLNYPVANEFKCDIPSYLNEYEKYRSNSLGLGIEIGMSEDTLLQNEFIAKNNNFDFILGSIHSINNIDIYNDYSKASYPKKEYFQYYLENMLKCVSIYNNFDSLAHIDYISRYAPFDNNEIYVDPYKDILEEIIKVLLSKGKVMELNTARLNNKLAQESLFEIYKLYKSLGGKYLTIGSDAHTSSAIARNFKIANEILETLNLKGVYFLERQMYLF